MYGDMAKEEEEGKFWTKNWPERDSKIFENLNCGPVLCAFSRWQPPPYRKWCESKSVSEGDCGVEVEKGLKNEILKMLCWCCCCDVKRVERKWNERGQGGCWVWALQTNRIFFINSFSSFSLGWTLHIAAVVDAIRADFNPLLFNISN